MKNDLKIANVQERLAMSYSPILGVNYGLRFVNADNEVNEWEPEDTENIE
jgi:hypothetical protein